ncbi:hypothetical protein [Escherichia coli]|uniref:hypothetical protein n=1 Tax=Escherichia coli TaxID=562 RepID=UPI001BFC9856|nr:hypothetical protein [Escherichia coli]
MEKYELKKYRLKTLEAETLLQRIARNVAWYAIRLSLCIAILLTGIPRQRCCSSISKIKKKPQITFGGWNWRRDKLLILSMAMRSTTAKLNRCAT